MIANNMEMMMRHISSILLLMMAGTAHAQSFEGAFAGVHAGLGFRSGGSSQFPALNNESKSGFDYGAFLGYDVRLGRSAVIGGQAEIGGGGATLRSFDAADALMRQRPKWNYAISARFGLIPAETVLIFARVGYSAERVRTTFLGPAPAVIGFDPTRNDWRSGVLLGGGAELAASPRASFRIEYRNRDANDGYGNDQVLIGGVLRF
jgi:opacity protein-like surface antigen